MSKNTKVLQYLYSVYFWIEIFGTAGLLYPVAVIIFIVTFPFDRRLYILHQFTCIMSFIGLKLNPLWKIKVEGRAKIDARETYIMVSNHQSGADILVLYLLRNHFKWVAKRSLFYYPFIGWNMWLNRYIAIDRGRNSSMRKMMAKAAKALREGNSIMMFPEGTRSKDGRVQHFKTGAFHLAIENKVPVLPVAIIGTSRAIRKGGLLVNRNHDIRLVVLDPIPYDSFRESNPKELAEKVRQSIITVAEKG